MTITVPSRGAQRCESHAGIGHPRPAAANCNLASLLSARLASRPRVATPESWTRAADKLYEAVAHFEAADDEGMRAQAAYFLANVQYGPRDQWAAAVRATEIATDAYESADDEAGIHNAATLRSAAEISLADAMNAGTQGAEQRALYATADRRLATAVDFFQSHAMPVRAQYATNMRAVLAVSTADYDSATTLLERSIEMARANNDITEQAKSLSNLAAVHNFRGFLAQSAKEYEALLPLVDPQTQPYLYAALLGNYGFTLIVLGDFDRALELHTEALKLYTEIGKDAERAGELGALGVLYLRMGDAERALQTLRAAIVEHERLGDNARLAGTMRVAASAASILGQRDAAIGYLRKSMQIDANPYNVARTRVLIAAELRVAGKLAEAEAELVEPQKSTNAQVHAEALEERAYLRLAQNRPDAAIEDLRAADRQYAELGLEFNRIDTNTALSQALLGRRDVPGALATANEAIAIVTRIRVTSANPEWRARFLSARYAPYEARIAAELASPDAGAVWHAFRTAEEVRARSLGDELALGATGAISAADPREEDLRAQLTSQQLLLEARIQRQDADEAGTVALRHSIEETRAQLDAILVRHGGVAARQTSLPDSLAQVQRQLPPGTAVLAYFVGDKSAHAWLLTRTELRHAALPGRDRMQRAIGDAVAARSGRTPGANLGLMLLGHLLDGIPESRMLVLADGPLNGVPFASLPIPGAGGELLIDRFVLGYAPSLALAMEKSRPAKTHNTLVAVVSDPVYAADDRRLTRRQERRLRHAAQCSAALVKQPDPASLFGARGKRGDQGLRIGRHYPAVGVRGHRHARVATAIERPGGVALRHPRRSATRLTRTIGAVPQRIHPGRRTAAVQPTDCERHRAQRTARRRRGSFGLRHRGWQRASRRRRARAHLWIPGQRFAFGGGSAVAD